MMARISRATVSLAALGLSLVFSPAAPAQQKEPTIYTYVAAWSVQRAHWGEFEAQVQERAKPHLDSLVQNGTLTEWGFDTAELHTPDGMTHSLWWSATSQGAIVKALDELRKMPENPAYGAVTRHSDLFLRSISNNVRMGGRQAAYDSVSSYQLRPGKAEEWLNFFNTFEKPVLDQLLSDGTILGYGVDEEDFHTSSPGARYLWILFADPAAMDQVDEAFDAARAKYSSETGRAIGASYRELVDPEAHRDQLSRIIDYSHK
jgi:hypothetical protein